jgi:RNA-binding protein
MDTASKKKLKAQAHDLKPVIIVGQAGYTDAVLAETEIALNTHELLKIKIRAEREERKQICEKICTSTGAALVQQIGQVAVIYRANPKISPKKDKPLL